MYSVSWNLKSLNYILSKQNVQDMQDVGKLLMGLGSGGADKKSSASIACFLGKPEKNQMI